MSDLRLAVYTDYAYHRIGGKVYAERAFATFLAELGTGIERLVIIGRLSPGSSKARYELGSVDFVPLPFYSTLAEPVGALAAMAKSLRGLWRGLDGVDAVWVIGPHLLTFPIALFAALRRKKLVLGIRQEYVAYVTHRHPGRRSWQFFARLLEGTFRLIARRCSAIVVGPSIAWNYRHSGRLLEISIPLHRRAEIATEAEALARRKGEDLRLLCVGRIEREKNPLLLAEVVSILRAADLRWRLTVCGEGPLSEQLAARFAELGMLDALELRGYIPHSELGEVYRSSDVLAHVSLTEGLPQVLYEAFAVGLPVVATDVGGISQAVGDAVLLAPSQDATVLAAQVQRLIDDPGLRETLLQRGLKLAREHTIESETARVAAFVSAA